MPLPTQFDHVFQILPTPSLILLPDAPKFTIAAVNDAFLLGFNISGKDLIGKGVFEVLPENQKDKASDDMAGLKDSLEQVIATMEPNKVPIQKYNIPIIGSTNFDVKYADFQNIPVKDDHNNITHILCSIEEVTEKRNLEKSFEWEKQRFFDLYSQSPSCMAIFKGPKHIYEMANPMILQLIGKNKEEVIGKSLMEVVPELEEQGLLARMDNVYKTGNAFFANEALVKFDVHCTGKLEESYFNFTYQAHRTKNGVVDGIFLFAIDVTEQVLSRRKIEESEKRYLELIQNLPVATYSCDPEGRILFYNKAASLLWGKEPETGKNLWCDSWKVYGLNSDSLHLGSCPMAVALKEGRTVSGQEIVVEPPNGDKRKVLSYPVPSFDSSGKVTGAVNMLVDITESKKAQRALEKSEKKYRQIVETAQEGILVVDKEQKIVFVNNKMCEIFEYSSEEIVGENILSLMDDEGKHQVKRLESKKEEYLHQVEFKYISKTGKEVWTRFSSNPLFNEAGVFKGKLAMVTDITENKKAREKLIQSEKRLKEAQKVANLGSWESAISGNELIFSEETCRIYGLSLEENKVSISDWLSLIHPEDLEEVLSEVKSAEKTLRESIYNHRIILKDGTLKYIFAKARYELDRHGKPKSVYGICHDITESKKAEEKLIQSEKRLKESQEIANLGNFYLDFSTNEALWSDECCRIYGLSPEENKQSYANWLSFIHPEDLEDVIKIVKESQETLKYPILNHRILLKDGTVKYIYSKCRYVFNQKGEAVGLSGINQDVTLRRTIERNLEQQNKELLKANKELDRFVYSASHDLRSPLTSILGLISFIEEESLETETLAHVKMIRTSINRLDGFIKNILSYSQNNRTDLETEKIPIEKNIHAVVDSLRSIKEAKGINFEINVFEQHPFYSDWQRFNTILENLISNAIKHHSEEKSGRFIKISGTSNHERLQLVIADNGIGIAPVHHEKIFDMFYRLSGKPNGSGIGLYIVKDTVEKLEGSIQIQSEVGIGSTFLINLKNLNL